uniref:Uncharacterized protein n=1 Tax=Arundo donax TaxID=35708 RepID=A0A0A8Y7Z5_ARUDO
MSSRIRRHSRRSSSTSTWSSSTSRVSSEHASSISSRAFRSIS